MNVRNKLRSQICRTVDETSKKQKIAFYQATYDHKHAKQLFYLLDMSLHKANSGEEDKDCFVDYRTKSVLDLNQAIQSAFGYDVLSFDVFDTLLFRKVRKPVDIFRILEEKNGIFNFASYRVQAEIAARNKKYSESGTYEVTLEEIYQMSELKCGFSPDALVKSECAEEMLCCYANPVLKEFVDYLCAKRKPMIAISDMYLKPEFIQNMLDKNGYSCIRKVFVSSRYGLSKSDGTLFDLVCDNLGGNLSVLHIGDNFYSDIIRCRNKSFHQLHYLHMQTEDNLHENCFL